ncbi:MFS transporter [Bacillus sp. USDA818B3_A]|uniref:MFS transporter n=1 Tax=Bacillus sp. USDA818B3_A TaxID=2698834 RepID=UPI00136970F6|nr:MFS transporter [Bacillus sp. USDA818B3_A]
MGALFRNKKYVSLLTAYMLSVLIDAIMFMELVKQVEFLSPQNYGYTGLYLFHFLPAALFSIPIGAWINSRHIVKVIRGSLIIRILVISLFLIVAGLSNMIFLYIFIFIESLMAAFILPSTDTLVTKVVKKRELTEANAWVKVSFVLMQMIGYGIATITIKLHISIYQMLLFSIIALGISALLISKVQYTVHVKTKSPQIKGDILELFQYLNRKRDMKRLFLLFASAWLVASSIDLIIIEYLTKLSHVPSENFGIIAIMVFIGMMIGAYFAPIVYQRMNVRLIFGLPLLVYTVTVFTMFLFHNWIYTLPFFLAGGVSLGIFEVCFTSYLQDNNEEKFYTRIFSLQGMVLSSMPLPGLLFLGGIIKFLGIQHTILMVSFFLSILALFALNTRFCGNKALIFEKANLDKR